MHLPQLVTVSFHGIGLTRLTFFCAAAITVRTSVARNSCGTSADLQAVNITASKSRGQCLMW